LFVGGLVWLLHTLNMTPGGSAWLATQWRTLGGRLRLVALAIGSLAALEPHPALGAYVAFKTALTVLYRTIALENQDKNITANVILPGTMDTPANRAAMPDADPSTWVPPADVAKVALLLASDAGAQINGALIPVSKG
jgi:NAD(P)-dependent dehydrogenase (short-subunit alcohol dehydrogenase family)